MTFTEEITLDAKAKYPLIWVPTSEEARLGKILKKIATELKRKLLCHSSTEGLRDSDAKETDGAIGGQPSRDLNTALDEIKKYGEPAIIMLKDPHKAMANAVTTRKFRDMYHVLKNQKKTIVICSPMLEIPPEMSSEVTIVDFDLPEADELGMILDDCVQSLGEQLDDESVSEENKSKIKEVYEKVMGQIKKNRDGIINAGMGLTSETFENIISKCIAQHSIEIPIILEEKKQNIRKSGLLEFYPAETNMADVGGLANLKRWFDLREKALGKEAQEYGLPAPKGIILLGIPGTGKSLIAKSLAARWNYPLLKMDVGAMFGSLVGQSEDRIRRALALAESASPAILWVDEIEKAFSFGSGDNGTSQRVFATLLTWMQDKKKPVFLIATANDISALPPELQRKGRFDEIFFLDLPNDEERAEIIGVHLKKKKFDPKKFDIPKIVAASENYVGAEIEQAVIDAMFSAFNEEKRPINTEDVVAAIKRIVPLSKSQQESIKGLRDWLKEGRAISASSSTGTVAEARKGRGVDVI